MNQIRMVNETVAQLATQMREFLRVQGLEPSPKNRPQTEPPIPPIPPMNYLLQQPLPQTQQGRSRTPGSPFVSEPTPYTYTPEGTPLPPREAMTPPPPQTEPGLAPPSSNVYTGSPMREMRQTGSSMPNPMDTVKFTIAGLKPPTFHGKDGENVGLWFYQMEQLFLLNRIPEEHKSRIAGFLIKDDAANYLYYLLVNRRGRDMSWQELRQHFRSKYENPQTYGRLLREKLEAVRFKGSARMADYCTNFRYIESQIFDMAFEDRLKHFIRPFPRDLALYITTTDLSKGDMEPVYALARQWAKSAVNVVQSTSFGNRSPSGRSLLQFSKPRNRTKPTTSKEKEKDTSDDEELNVIRQLEHLNAADMSQVVCYNCNKRGHFARDCKSKPTSTRFTPTPSRRPNTASSSNKPNGTLFQTVDVAEEHSFDRFGYPIGVEYSDDERTYDPSERSKMSETNSI